MTERFFRDTENSFFKKFSQKFSLTLRENNFQLNPQAHNNRAQI